jgi:hypothetical protein
VRILAQKEVHSNMKKLTFEDVMRFVFLALLGLLSFWSPQPAQAQTPVAMYCYQGPTNPQWSPCSASNQLQVSASVTASVTGFAPNGNYASITSAGTSGSVALPAGAVVVFSNTGTATVSCTLGVGSATAVAGEIQIPASSSVAFTVGSNTFGACIDQTGSTSNTVVLAGGTGLFTGFGGGGGSGGGGAITAASGAFASGSISNGADVVEGTITSAHTCSTGGYTVIGCLGQIDDDVKGAIPAGTNIIGKVGIDQTTPGTTNGVQVNAALPAGTNAIGTITGNVNVTPTDCSGTITTGGTAQNAIAASATIHGFTIANIDTSAGSGEPLWISFTTTAAASTVASYPLSAPTATTFAGLSSYTSPLGFGLNHALSIVGATTGHKFSCTTW